MSLVVHKTSPSCVIAHHGPVLIALWRGPVNVADLDAFSAFVDVTHKGFPAGYVTLTIATAAMKPPDGELRQYIAELRSRRSGSSFKGSVLVLAGEGFWASIMRTMVAGMNLVSGQHLHERLVRTFPEASSATHALLPEIDAPALLHSLEQLTAPT